MRWKTVHLGKKARIAATMKMFTSAISKKKSQPSRRKRRDKPAVLHLITDDARQPQTSNEKENRNNGEAKRKLIGKHLRTGTNAAEERIFRIGCPTANDDSVDAEGRYCEYKQNPDVHIGNYHWHPEQRAAERHQRD